MPSATPSPTPTPVDPAAVNANEVGLVPVLMYHRLVPVAKGEYDRTPADFRAELQRVFAAGYRPVRTIDFVRGEMGSTLAAGYSPVVLSFDDGYQEHLRIADDGTIDPDCAVGIVQSVAAAFPDCKAVGTLNINKDPFALHDPADIARAVKVLDAAGWEIGNHTYNHDNLKKLDDAGVQRDLVELQEMVRSGVPDASVRTMALPFGVRPEHHQLARAGSADGQTYLNEGVMLVGSNPAPSPFSAAFDPLAVPRIRSTSYGGGTLEYASRYWLDYLARHPEKRYVSAGQPGKVVVPAASAGKVAARFKDRVVTY